VIDPDILDRIGKLRDTADNILHARLLQLPDRIHIEGMTGALEDIKAEADSIYKELGGTE
jgi:hypothetical protein